MAGLFKATRSYPRALTPIALVLALGGCLREESRMPASTPAPAIPVSVSPVVTNVRAELVEAQTFRRLFPGQIEFTAGADPSARGAPG